MNDAIICKHVIVKGNVQGVGFRNAVYQEAKRIGGIKGWVRNLDSGDVEMLVQGEPAKVDALIQWCHKGGPPNARVDVVNDRQVKVEPALTSFGVRKL